MSRPSRPCRGAIERERGALLRLPAVAFIDRDTTGAFADVVASRVVIVRHAGICACAALHDASTPPLT